MFQKSLFREQLKTMIGNQTSQEFSDNTGISRTYISKYLNMRLDIPPKPQILKKMSTDTVTYEDLMVSCGYLQPRTFSEQNAIPIPVIGVVHAGIPTFAKEDIESYEYIDPSEISNPHLYFYLRVEGDSMENARIYAGDLVFVRKQSDVESGDIAVVMIDDELATLKRVIKKKDTLVLQPENSKYAALIFKDKDLDRVHIIGKVLHVKFKL